MRLTLLLTFIGVLATIHGLYSAIQVRTTATNDDESIPIDIWIELFAGVLISSISFIFHTASSLQWKNISLTRQFNSATHDTISFRPDFMTFNHRAKAIYVTKEKQQQSE
jgi:hypothetical protein